MAIDPRDPLESIDVSETQPFRTEIARVKRQLFNIGEDNEDPKVIYKYYRNMAARYGDNFVIARRQDGSLWSWGCSDIEPSTIDLLDITGSGTSTFGQLYIGQSFTPEGGDWDVNQIYVNYAWRAGGATHCKLTIRADSGGNPGTILATADLLAISDTAAPGGEYTFTFSSPPTLTSGNLYWAIFQGADSGGNESGFFFWYSGGDTYDNGGLTYSTDGAAWNPSGPTDIRKMKIRGFINLSGYPQFGLGDTSPSSIPTMINAGGVEFSRVFAPGRLHTIALDVSGAPYAWGFNTYGQLGTRYWSAIGAGDLQSALLDNDGKLWTWGNNLYGNLGDGTTTTRSSPVTVVDTGPWAKTTNVPNEFLDVCNIPGICDGIGDTGGNFLWAFKEDGSLWTVGRSNFGQLGTGAFGVSYSSPVSVFQSSLREFWQCSGGQNTMACIDQNGHIWTWGRGSDGKLGIWGPTTGSPNSINAPANVDLAMLSNPLSIQNVFAGRHKKMISVGGNCMAVLDQYGQGWAWGNNLAGQLGNNDDAQQNGWPQSVIHPVAVVFSQVAAGNDTTLWLDVDGI